MTVPDPAVDDKSTQAVVRNRRLQYLRTHPEYLEPKRESDTESVGGRISANLLAAYDLDRRLEAKKEHERRNGEEETSSEESIEDRESALKRAKVEDFLDGKDKDFDYALVDNDSSLDDSITLDRDQEDRYFSQSPEEGIKSSDTGVQDF